jgi:hypothetical protein
MVSANRKVTPPLVRAPGTDGLDEADELPLVSLHLEMAGGKWIAEVSEGPGALMKDRTEPHTRRVTVDDEELGEIQHLEHRPCRQGVLKGVEGGCRVVVPSKRVSPQ